MNALVIRLMHRLYGQALISHIAALTAWQSSRTARALSPRMDWLDVYGNPPIDNGDRLDAVLQKYQHARAVFLAGEWDTLITIEDDLVLPEDTFTRLEGMLANETTDIAYGLTCWRHSFGGGWSSYTQVDEHEGYSILTDIENARQLFDRQAIIDVVGIGMYCTAFKRHVVEAVPFTRRGEHAQDWYFSIDAQKAGFTSRCDLGLVCGHITMEPTPRVLYPDSADDMMQRIEFL